MAFHPVKVDYLDLALSKQGNQAVEAIKRNLREAVEYLRDEESYGHRNVHDRCHFILADDVER